MSFSKGRVLIRQNAVGTQIAKRWNSCIYTVYYRVAVVIRWYFGIFNIKEKISSMFYCIVIACCRPGTWQMRGPVNYHAFSREHSTYFSSALACSTYIRSLLARNGCFTQGLISASGRRKNRDQRVTASLDFCLANTESLHVVKTQRFTSSR